RGVSARVGNAVDPTVAWRRVIDTITRNLGRWNKRHPSMYGRKLIVGLEVGSRTQFLAAAQGMPKSVETEIAGVIAKFMWDREGAPLINKAVLHAPVGEGGIGLLDLSARNAAIDLMWLRTYLAPPNLRPRWAYLADALFAGAPPSTLKTSDRVARMNMFTQDWKASTHPRAGLPRQLHGWVKAAKKYNVRLDPLLPDDVLRLAIPIWHH
ncbi:hypothetical protein C2E23DRAFT_691655, partial [Lenzites betulinus]